jgi:hypothetical protein
LWPLGIAVFPCGLSDGFGNIVVLFQGKTIVIGLIPKLGDADSSSVTAEVIAHGQLFELKQLFRAAPRAAPWLEESESVRVGIRA